MPHRTTYFFPRQFPDRGFDASSNKQLLSHEKKITKQAFTIENDRKSTKDFTTSKNSPVSDNFTSIVEKLPTKNQFAAFCDWLAEGKGERSGHVKRKLSSSDEDRELLLPPQPVPLPETVVNDRSVDRNFDRQVSLPRLSSGSSYAGSLFSGTTMDGNFSSDVKDSTTTKVSTTTRVEVEVEVEEESKESLAQRTTESYYLQLCLARRLSLQANLDNELVSFKASGPEVTSDAETVSHRLWVLLIYLFMQWKSYSKSSNPDNDKIQSQVFDINTKRFYQLDYVTSSIYFGHV